jgi:hypothetical protein
MVVLELFLVEINDHNIIKKRRRYEYQEAYKVVAIA